MKKNLPLFIWMAVLSFLFLACEKESIEPSSTAFSQPPATNVQPPVQAQPPATPAKNCKVTLYNASSNPYAYMSLALGSPDMAGLLSGHLACPLTPGQSTTICLPQGQLTLYTFSNMYQFSNGISVTIGPDPITLRLKSGH